MDRQLSVQILFSILRMWNMMAPALNGWIFMRDETNFTQYVRRWMLYK